MGILTSTGKSLGGWGEETNQAQLGPVTKSPEWKAQLQRGHYRPGSPSLQTTLEGGVLPGTKAESRHVEGGGA